MPGSTPNPRGDGVPGVVGAGHPSRVPGPGGRVSTRRGAHPPVDTGCAAGAVVPRWSGVRRRGGLRAVHGALERAARAGASSTRSGCRSRSRVLDLGCGTGNLTRAVAERWPALRGRGGRPVGAVRRGRPRAGRVVRPPGALRAGRRRATCRSTTTRSMPPSPCSCSTSCPTPTGRVAELRRVVPTAAGCWRPACGTTARAWRCCARLWDAAARLDPTVVGPGRGDDAARPRRRPDGPLAAGGPGGRSTAAGSPSPPTSRTSTTTGSRSCRGRARPASTSPVSRMPTARPCARRSPRRSGRVRSSCPPPPGGCAARCPSSYRRRSARRGDDRRVRQQSVGRGLGRPPPP